MNFKGKTLVIRVAKEILLATEGKSLEKDEMRQRIRERIMFALPPAGLLIALRASPLFHVTESVISLCEVETAADASVPEESSVIDASNEMATATAPQGSYATVVGNTDDTAVTEKTPSPSSIKTEAIIRVAEEVLATDAGKMLTKGELAIHVAERVGLYIGTRAVKAALQSSSKFCVTNGSIELSSASTASSTTAGSKPSGAQQLPAKDAERALDRRMQVAQSVSAEEQQLSESPSVSSAALSSTSPNESHSLSLTPQHLSAEALCLSDFAQVMTQCMQLYVVQASDLPLYKATGQVVAEGSVGIQCKLCSVSQKGKQQSIQDGDLLFPNVCKTLAIIFYQFVERHLIGKCACISQATKTRLRRTKHTSTSQSMHNGRIGLPTYLRFIMANYQLADGLPYGIFHRDHAAAIARSALPVVAQPRPPHNQMQLEPKQSRRVAERKIRMEIRSRSPSPQPTAKANKRRRKKAAVGEEKSKSVVIVTPRKNEVQPTEVSDAAVEGLPEDDGSPKQQTLSENKMEVSDKTLLQKKQFETFLTLEHPGFVSSETSIVYEDF